MSNRAKGRVHFYIVQTLYCIVMADVEVEPEQAVAGISNHCTRDTNGGDDTFDDIDDTMIHGDIGTEQVLSEKKPSQVEVKGHFRSTYENIWDCTVGKLLQPDKFIFTHCRIFSKDRQPEWLRLNLVGISSYNLQLSSEREPPGYQAFKKPVEHLFQRLVYARDTDNHMKWISDLDVEYQQFQEEGRALAATFLKNFFPVRIGFLFGMSNSAGRTTVYELLQLLESFICVKEEHHLKADNVGGASVIGHGKVTFIVEPNSTAKGIETRKRKRTLSDDYSIGSKSPASQISVISSPASPGAASSRDGSEKNHSYNTCPTSPEDIIDYSGMNEGQVQVSSGTRLQKAFVPDVVWVLRRSDTGMVSGKLLTVSVKHDKLDDQAVRQLVCEMLPVVLEHGVAMGLLINDCEAYRIRLIKARGEITDQGSKFSFVAKNPHDDFGYFAVNFFNAMCVQIINDCQQIYNDYFK